AQGLDDVGHGDSPVSDEQQILTVLPVGRRGEVVRAEVDAGRRLVEVDDDELVVHARAPAAYRLRLEGLRHVLAEGGWHHGRDVAVGPSTMTVLLCCSLPMCCRFTCFAPADATRR